jgi:uncharacterized integral membrane protein
MKRLFWLITGPFALLVIAFAVANRRPVTLSFDPFSLDAPAIALSLPLWLIAFGALLIGVVLGGAATWIARTHGELRRAAKKRIEIRSARAPDPLEGVPSIAGSPTAAAPMTTPPSSVLTRRG